MSEPSPAPQTEPSRLCLFGGSFDPVHLGHIAIARAAVDALALDQVRFLPCRISPHKRCHTPSDPAHRYAMLELATADLPWAVIDRFDLDAPEPSYSWRTALAMRDRFPNARLFWLVGGDQWHDLPRWARPEILASTLEFIVVARGAEIEPRSGWSFHVLPAAHPASASGIRANAAQKLRSDWLHPAVARYIQKHRLFQ